MHVWIDTLQCIKIIHTIKYEDKKLKRNRYLILAREITMAWRKDIFVVKIICCAVLMSLKLNLTRAWKRKYWKIKNKILLGYQQ